MIPIVIPAFRPGTQLLDVVQALAEDSAPVIVVDDGSGPSYTGVFDACRRLPSVRVLQHAVNLGKGAALKTGINHALCAFPDCAGVVTADADGQHHPADIQRVARRLAASPGCLVLGARDFSGPVPLRSKFGNIVTCGAVRFVLGEPLADTQTGLRGIPRSLLAHLLRIPSTGYEFELDMLTACKHRSCRVIQEPIRTIYAPGNASSLFNPLLDSMRIYYVLLRFSAVSLLTAAVDNLVFILVYGWISSILGGQILARSAAILFNYSAARKAVFLSNAGHSVLFPRYLALVIVSGLLSYAGIVFLSSNFGIPVIWAKISAESALFLVNFAVQRDFVFTSKLEDRVEPAVAAAGIHRSRE